MPNDVRNGLKAVAVFEAAKGALVLLAGLAAFSLIHQNVQLLAEQLVGQMHLNPAKHFPRIFAAAAADITDSKLIFFSVLALLYSSMRFIEAYGLWTGRKWAEWFALFSAGSYLPVEFFELAKGVSWMKIGFVALNLVIVFYLIVVLFRNGRFSRRAARDLNTCE